MFASKSTVENCNLHTIPTGLHSNLKLHPFRVSSHYMCSFHSTVFLRYCSTGHPDNCGRKNGCYMEVDYVSSGESATEAEVGTSVKKSDRHTPAQLATLNAYYKVGMVGVGKDYTPLIPPQLIVIFLRGK